MFIFAIVEIIFVLAFVITISAVTGVIAKKKGRNVAGWVVLSIFIGWIALVIVAVLQPVNKTASQTPTELSDSAQNYDLKSDNPEEEPISEEKAPQKNESAPNYEKPDVNGAEW